MRLFAALYPPEPAVADLRALVARASRPASPDASGPPPGGSLRWTEPQLWHVTLAFFGEVPGGEVARVARRCARAAARGTPARLRVTGLGAFPRASGRHARVIWAGLEGDVDLVHVLANAAAGARDGLGGPPDRRSDHQRYHPHVTLARSRSREGADVAELISETAEHRGPWWAAESLVLMRSHLGPQVRHEQVQAWPLAGPG